MPGRNRAELRAIYRRLSASYGPQHWWPAETPFEVMVGAVLTQNTAWSNVEKAVAVLKTHRLLDPGRFADLPRARLSSLIRSAGFHNVKARRLLCLARWLRARGGIRGLAPVPTADLRAELLRVHGVGPETADSILLYALRRPVFVVDSYTRRILYRYGLTTGSETHDELRLALESALRPDVMLFNEYHALLVRLAKEHCRATPACRGCPLAGPEGR